jgi:trypsin-like peptidase
MRSFLIPALVFSSHLVLLTCLAQQPTQSPPTAPPQQATASTLGPMSDPKGQIRNTVGFLTVDYRNGLVRGGVMGTCFFVAVRDERLGGNKGFTYLVTNRHVAQPGIDLGTPYQVQAVYIRMNLATPERGVQSVQEQIPIGDQLHWFFPSDDAVDLAILPITPDVKKYAYLNIDSSTLASSELNKANQVGVGDTVIFAGYFSSFSGQNRMEPIVRQGVLAMLPQERLDTTLHKKGQLILADLHAFHGNSGSPVFVNVGGTHGSLMGSDNYILLGVLSGYYPESAGFSVPAATILTGEVRDNSGIATIVPSEELTKLLNSSEVQADRDRNVAILTKKP